MAVDPISLAVGLAQFAPSVMKWLGSSDKAVEAATTVVDIAKDVTGSPTGVGALHVLSGNSDKMMEFRAAIAKQEAELDALYLRDVQNARTVHAQHWMPSALTIGLAVMVTALVGALVFFPMPTDNKEVIYLVAGQVIGAFSTAIAYWLGSSRGSASKTDEINAVLRRIK